jgi:hypothetical protein
MALGRIKTEMTGTGGGRWMHRYDAKLIANKIRRREDKQEEHMLEGESTYQKLLQIENDIAFLSDSDQQSIIGYKLVVDTGGTLTPAAIATINRIYASLVSEHKSMEMGFVPLTMAQVVKDLLSAEAMMNQPEQAFFRRVKALVQARSRLTPEDSSNLLRLYSLKGF